MVHINNKINKYEKLYMQLEFEIKSVSQSRPKTSNNNQNCFSIRFF
jgi:hypothetical protein